MPYTSNSHGLNGSDDSLKQVQPSTNYNGKLPETQLESFNDDWSDASQDLLNALPRVWTRGLLYFLVFFVAIVLPWAIFYKVDETGTAKGRLEPKGNPSRVDTPVAGTVTKVLVHEGDIVQKNQPLMELESEQIRAQMQQSQTNLEGEKNRLTQLSVGKNQLAIALAAQQQQNQAQSLEKFAQVDQARQAVDASKANYNLQKTEKLAQVEQARQAVDASITAYNFVSEHWAKDLEKLQRYTQAYEEHIISKMQLDDVEQAVGDSHKLQKQAQSEISQAKSRLKEQQGSYEKTMHQALFDIEQASSRLQEQQSGYQSLIEAGKLAVLKSEGQLNDINTQITSLKTEITQSESQIEALKFELAQREIKAPVTGVIFQLPIQRPGAVLQPSQMVAEIAPNGRMFVLKAQIDTQESGFLHEGMPVKIKFDAYHYQDYGIVEGRLSRISKTSKVTTQGGNATYDLDIELKQSCIQAANECIALTPGQTATAEVILRQRRVIDFILAPFKKLQKGGLKL